MPKNNYSQEAQHNNLFWEGPRQNIIFGVLSCAKNELNYFLGGTANNTCQ